MQLDVGFDARAWPMRSEQRINPRINLRFSSRGTFYPAHPSAHFFSIHLTCITTTECRWMMAGCCRGSVGPVFVCAPSPHRAIRPTRRQPQRRATHQALHCIFALTGNSVQRTNRSFPFDVIFSIPRLLPQILGIRVGASSGCVVWWLLLQQQNARVHFGIEFLLLLASFWRFFFRTL